MALVQVRPELGSELRLHCQVRSLSESNDVASSCFAAQLTAKGQYRVIDQVLPDEKLNIDFVLFVPSGSYRQGDLRHDPVCTRQCEGKTGQVFEFISCG